MITDTLCRVLTPAQLLLDIVQDGILGARSTTDESQVDEPSVTTGFAGDIAFRRTGDRSDNSVEDSFLQHVAIQHEDGNGNNNW